MHFFIVAITFLWVGLVGAETTDGRLQYSVRNLDDARLWSALTIYGEDGRLEAIQTPPQLQDLAHASAVALHVTTLPFPLPSTGAVELPGVPARMRYGMCEAEPFADQRAPGICSGFLVGPDLLATAGHCLSATHECGNEVWAFGFHADELGNSPASLPAGKLFTCRKVIRYDSVTDFALVQLDRPVQGVQPLVARQAGSLTVGTAVGIVGHPLGMPSKMDLGGKVVGGDDTHFIATLDSFVNNSGSAVFNLATLEVEGILVAGAQDFVYDAEAQCERLARCAVGECAGEQVTRVSQILELHGGPRALEAAGTGDIDTVRGYLQAGGWVDISDAGMNTMLHHAYLESHMDIVHLLIIAGADASRRNLMGKRPHESHEGKAPFNFRGITNIEI
jgi:hypothetical protein